MDELLAANAVLVLPTTPGIAPLRGTAAPELEAWRNRAISIDYRSGLVTYQKGGINSGYMEIFRYPAEPMIEVQVNGRTIAAIVDTTSPDTLVLPGSAHGRGTANVRIGRTDFGVIDVQLILILNHHVAGI